MADVSTTELVGQTVTNVGGERIGKVERLLYQGDREEPDWALIKLGRLGLHKQIIPLEHVRTDEGQLQIIEEREWVRQAPDVKLDGDRLSDEEADQLRLHYGLERETGLTVEEDDIELPRETRDAKPPAMDEEPDNPITKRRRERAKELGIPSANDAPGEH